jgi:hypothetical protein
VEESGFIYFRATSNFFSSPRASASEVATKFEFEAEYWSASVRPITKEDANDSGCATDRALCFKNRTLYSDYCRCTNRTSFNHTIIVKRARRLPRLGFGGFMLALDGGDDFFVVDYGHMPQYEFGLQFWFQQNKIREGQSLFTWWSETRGREWEVADTSNIFYYHFNNKTQRTGVGVNDGKWHHLAFSWRLHCKPEMRIPGATYCVQGLSPFVSKFSEHVLPICDVDRDCTHVEVTLMVDGVKRAETKLPTFLISAKGQLVFGQSMQKPFKTNEIYIRDEYIQEIRAKWQNITSNLMVPFSDNQLQLMFSRLRSGYNSTQLFAASLSKQAREALYCEDEPWREPFSKYCDHNAPGGFRPGAALSGNIDEFRIYDYYRTRWDVELGMDVVISHDGVNSSHYTTSPLEGNWSLLLYYTFDLQGADFMKTSKDQLMDWPLTIDDEAPFRADYEDWPASLGGGVFRWAPLRVPSTAPIRGSRTVQISIPDNSEPIPISVLDLVSDPDTPPSGIFSRIEERAKFGPMYTSADDCDSVSHVTLLAQEPKVISRPEGCRGSIIGFEFLPGVNDGCKVGDKINASDPHGSGMSARISIIKPAGTIGRIDMLSMGRGYDWVDTLGMYWQNLSTAPSGKQITNLLLASALSTKQEFTHEEFEAFRIPSLLATDYTKVGANFFQPIADPYRTQLSVDSALCRCNGRAGNIVGSFNDCLRPIVSAGKADPTGADFAGFDVDVSGDVTVDLGGLPVFQLPTCTATLPMKKGTPNCPGVKPRPCQWGCHRYEGWMTDILATKDDNDFDKMKPMLGPFTFYEESGKNIFWQNSRHTVWYVPEHLRESDYYIKNAEGNLVLQDTIKDQFLIRFWDYLPPSDSLASQMASTQGQPPFSHLWVQIVYEKLAIPLNTSIIWEESSAMLLQLHVVDFDRGTCVLNSPFRVHVDVPSRGTLYQAVRIEKAENETEFMIECVCPTSPRFPKLNRTLELQQYGANTDLPGIRPCDVSKIGSFCFKRGPKITSNDTFVESTMETLVIPGFQHARDGFFVIYDMGVEQSGASQVQWRLKHPQGQVANATVDIMVRSINNGPLAFAASIVTEEDTFKEVKIDSFDVDDVRKPAMFVTEFPAHGTLYQCNATSSASPCRLGEKFSRVNASEPQWADVRIDSGGAIDDEVTAVLRVLDTNDPKRPRIMRNHPNTSTKFAHGYGFGSYNFDPDKPDNFRKLCNTRGSIAADLWLKSPVFVTGLDLFYPFRPDTPFRVLAQRQRQFEYISYDYNTGTGSQTMQPFEVTNTKVTKEGLTYKKDENMQSELNFVDTGKWKAEQSFSYLRSDCGQGQGIDKSTTICQQIWDGDGFVRSEERSTITEEIEQWFELFRGLPHHAAAEHDRSSPVFADTLFQTDRLRVEACGANMRVFGEEMPNFLQSLKRVRVWGSKTQRAKGTVTSLDRRMVYVPDYDYVGPDSFKVRVQDHGGGALRSSSQFSLQRHWSPVVTVDIQVRSGSDKPLATSVVASQVLGTHGSEIVISTPGIHPGPNGNKLQRVTTFSIEITKMPSRGSVFLGDGSRATETLTNYDGILRFRTPSLDGCGKAYDDFKYRVKNAAGGDNQFSREHSVTVQLRCKTGYTCDLPTFTCKACPAGTYGDDSAVENTCNLCPAGTYQGGTAAKSCTPCPPGSYGARPGATECVLCPEGTYNNFEQQVSCVACPGGTFGPFPGLLECRKCGSKHWTLATGAFTCKECPANTRTRLDNAVGIENCVCEHGYYNVEGKSGVKCIACPPGAYCHGRNLLPVARTGYWTSQGLWTKDYEDMETGNITRGVAYFAPCSFRYLRGVCIGYPDVDVQEQEERCQYRDHQVVQGPVRLHDYTSEGVNVNISFCTLRDLSVPGEAAPDGLRSWIMRQAYTANSYCARGYTGVICSECSQNFHRGLTSYCFECSQLYKIPIVNLLLFLITLVLNCSFWIVMMIAACHRARSLYITISHFQLIAMFARLGVPWPDNTQGPIHFSSIFNFNLDGIQSNCLGMRADFQTRWVWEMFIPVFIVLGVYFYFYYRVMEALANVRAEESHERDGASTARSSASAALITSQTKPKNAKSGTGKSVAAIEFNNKEDAGRALDKASEATGDDASVDEQDKDSGSEVSDKEDQHGQEKAVKVEWDRDIVKLLTQKEIRKLRDAGIWYTSMSLNVLFVMATSTLLIPFNCTKVSDTLHYLDWSPGSSCSHENHSNMIFFSYVLGLCWIIVFPSVQFYILRKAWHNELIMDRLFIRQFGWLFDCYEAKHFWWELAVLFRKAFIVGIANTVTDNTYLQLLSLGVFLTIYLFWTFYMQPYVHERHNVVDMFLQMQFIMIILFALTNIVGNDGMKIMTPSTGTENTNERIHILEPEPDMDAIGDKYVNNNPIANLIFMVITSLTAFVNLCMVLYDLYESRVHAPEWAPYLFNAIFGGELWDWDEFVSNVLAGFDRAFTAFRDRNKVKPPDRPASRWAHRVMMMEGVAKVDDFSTHESVEAMLAAAVAATQEEEWARDKESCTAYIRSLDKRIFASEMYNSKAANLPILERQRNLAKKRLLQFLYDEVGDVFKALYDQTGLNEETIWDIQELERLRQEKAIIEAGEVEHKKHLLKENDEQQRRIGKVAQWKAKYEEEMQRCKV